MTRPTVSIQAAIGPGVAPNAFIVGSSLVGGTDVVTGAEIVGQGLWEELGDRCYSVSVRRGRQRLLEQYPAGTCAALFDNTDGDLDPANTTGPYAEDGVSLIQPMRAIRVIYNWAGTDWPRYYGYTDRWVVNPSYPEGGSVSVAATDAFKIFTRIDPLEQTAVGAGDDTGERINRILDEAEWSLTMRDIDTGDDTHQATTLAQPIATQLRLASDSERGDLYVDGRGFPTFRRRTSRYVDFRSTAVQWVIGDGDGELHPAEWSAPVVDDELIRNDVNVARIGGAVITRRSAEGEVAYLRSTYTRTDLTLADDVQVAGHAERVLRLFKDPAYRIDSVTFEPDGVDDDDLWRMIVSAEFGDRVTCNLTHPDTGVVFSGDYFIESIADDVPVLGSGQWRTTFALADASKFPTNPFIVGSSLVGGTDVLV